MKGNRQDILFLAQLPPPFHGQSVVAGEIHRIFLSQPHKQVRHLWLGGARNATDVGKRSLSKYLKFLWMLVTLAGYFVSGRRFGVAYLGVAPWAHTIFRDALLILAAKPLADRCWIHVHGDGLARYLKPVTLKEKLVSAAFSGTELIAITVEEAARAHNSALFTEVHHLPNFSDDPRLRKSRKTGTIHLGTVGNLDPRKGISEFVETIRLLKQDGHSVKGTIVGGPTASLTVDALKRQVDMAGLNKQISVTGRVVEEEKNRLLSEFDVFLYPSRHDLAPLSVIEAIAHGCVPVVLATGGIPEIVGEALQKNVLPASLSAEEFSNSAAEIIAGYISAPETLHNDSVLARSRFLETYTKKRFEGNVLAMLNRDITLHEDKEFQSQAGEVA